MIHIEGLSKSFSRNETALSAVDHADLHIEKGRFVGIVGHSGSGKTTLFNLLGGLVRPTEGKIVVNGTDIAGFSEKEMADYRRKTIGYILQGHNMLNNFTILENVCMPAYLSGETENAEQRAMELLEQIGLADLANDRPENLSGGELRRIAIARAMVNHPPVILADEPTSNLDPENARRVMELLKVFHQNGTTILISTHELEYLSYTDSVYEMDHGRLKQIR